MKHKDKLRPLRQQDRRSLPHGPLIRLSDDLRAPSYRINMLDPENFTVALLGEFGFTHKTIGDALGLTPNQVGRRLKFAKVRTMDYRQGRSVIGRMILTGVAKAGVPELRHFAESMLSQHLKQLGWDAARMTPELEAAPARQPKPNHAPATAAPPA